MSFLLFFFFQFYFAAATNSALVATACFYDVGQGHCFLLKTKDDKFGVLVDAGSSKLPKLTVPQQTEKNKQAIVSSIAGKAKNISKLLVICTHGDEDHYNLIKDIVKGRSVGTQTKFVFGGRKEHYNVGKLPEVSGQQPIKFFLDDSSDESQTNQEISVFFSSGDDGNVPIAVHVLSRGMNSPGQTEEDKNKTSLVVRVIHRNSDKSFLLTGDAPSTTLNGLQSLKSSVLLANHHGASLIVSSGNAYAWYAVCKFFRRLKFFQSAKAYMG